MLLISDFRPQTSAFLRPPRLRSITFYPEYATASMDNRLFVLKYAVELPSKNELEKFLHARHLEMAGNA